MPGKIYKTLFVFFSDRFSFLKNKSTFLSDLKKKDKFSNAQETILPIPDDAPPEIPIMILSKANSYEIRFSRNRIDITLQETDETNILSIVNDIYSVLEEKPKHIGFVIYSYFDEISEDLINQRIGKLFSDEGKNTCGIEDSAEFLLRNLRKEKIKLGETGIFTNTSFMLNTIMKINNEKKIAMEFDINTFPSEALSIGIELINHFINESFNKNNQFADKLFKVLK